MVVLLPKLVVINCVPLSKLLNFSVLQLHIKMGVIMAPASYGFLRMTIYSNKASRKCLI